MTQPNNDLNPALLFATFAEEQARQTMEGRITLFRAAIGLPQGLKSPASTMARQDVLEAVSAWLDSLENTAIARFTIYFGDKK